MGKRKYIRIFILLLIAQCFVTVMWGTQKVRLNVDEMFTMEGVKQGGYGKGYWDKAEDFYGNEHTHQEFLDYMTVASDDLLIYRGIGEVYDALMHRNFYYSVLNLVSTIYPGYIPWMVGVGLNLIFFVVSQTILFMIAKETLGEVGALCTVAVYGFSAGAISTVLYVRCYMMLTMYILLLIYLYLKFMHTEKVWQKVLYIVSFDLMAVVSYRTHQFGAILFAIITALFIIYMIVSRRGKCFIWMTVGCGLPVLLGAGIVLPRLQSFFGGGIAALFYTSVRNMSGSRLIINIVQMLRIIAQHLFVKVGIVLMLVGILLLLYARIVYMRCKNADRYREKADLYLPVIVVSVCTVVIYYSILIMGSAAAWKYLSPVYPLIVLTFMSMAVYISRMMGIIFRTKALIAGGWILLTLTSYDTQHISELFAEEAGLKDILEEQYQGVNGIMVHHDMQGDGENWLYEAATLWPEGSEVLVLQHHMILEKGLFEFRNDDRILLWLTADFDRDESISLFIECTDYTDIELILNTDHVWVYECKK